MRNISLPKKFIIEETVKEEKAKIIIEPCFPGYGITLGNALRRVLLSSLPGGAVTAVKIKGIQHEFSVIKNVVEDVVEIILNLKKLSIRVHSEEPVVLKLKAKGEKEVTGADIESSADAEIINKDLHLATLTNKEAELEMELIVAKGIGYVPVEEQNKSKEKGEIGLILVDSIFTPVLKVGIDVEATRVGQKVDYDKLILNIETDGTISPEKAVQKAAEILANQFDWIIKGGREEIEAVDIEAPVILPIETPEQIKEEILTGEKEEKREIQFDSVANEAAENMENKEENKAEAETEETEEKKPKKRGRPRKIEKIEENSN